MFYDKVLLQRHRDYSQDPNVVSKHPFTALLKSHVYYITEGFINALEKVNFRDVENDKKLLHLPFDNIFLNFEKPLETGTVIRSVPNQNNPPVEKKKKTNSSKIYGVLLAGGQTLKALFGDIKENVGTVDHLFKDVNPGLDSDNITVTIYTGRGAGQDFIFEIDRTLGELWIARLSCPTIATFYSDSNEIIIDEDGCPYRTAMTKGTVGRDRAALDVSGHENFNGALPLCIHYVKPMDNDTNDVRDDVACPMFKNSIGILYFIKRIIWTLIYREIKCRKVAEKKRDKPSKMKRLERREGFIFSIPEIPTLVVRRDKRLVPKEVHISEHPEYEDGEKPIHRLRYRHDVVGSYHKLSKCANCGKRIYKKERGTSECPVCHHELELKYWLSWHPPYERGDKELPKVKIQHNIEG